MSITNHIARPPKVKTLPFLDLPRTLLFLDLLRSKHLPIFRDRITFSDPPRSKCIPTFRGRNCILQPSEVKSLTGFPRLNHIFQSWEDDPIISLPRPKATFRDQIVLRLSEARSYLSTFLRMNLLLVFQGQKPSPVVKSLVGFPKPNYLSWPSKSSYLPASRG